MAKFLDATGLAHLWEAIENKIRTEGTNPDNQALSIDEIDAIIGGTESPDPDNGGNTSGGGGFEG